MGMKKVTKTIARLYRVVTNKETVEDAVLRIRATTDSLLLGFRAMVSTLKGSADQLDEAKKGVDQEIVELKAMVKQKNEMLIDLSKEVDRFNKIANNIGQMIELFDEEEVKPD